MTGQYASKQGLNKLDNKDAQLFTLYSDALVSFLRISSLFLVREIISRNDHHFVEREEVQINERSTVGCCLYSICLVNFFLRTSLVNFGSRNSNSNVRISDGLCKTTYETAKFWHRERGPGSRV